MTHSTTQEPDSVVTPGPEEGVVGADAGLHPRRALRLPRIRKIATGLTLLTLIVATLGAGLEGAKHGSTQQELWLSLGIQLAVGGVLFIPLRMLYSVILFYWAVCLALIEVGTIRLSESLSASSGKLKIVAAIAGSLSRLVMPSHESVTTDARS